VVRLVQRKARNNTRAAGRQSIEEKESIIAPLHTARDMSGLNFERQLERIGDESDHDD
jgi:hypothetical protein